MDLTKTEMYPDCDTLSNVASSGYITARDQSTLESGVTEGGKNTANFFFVNEHNYTNMKPKGKRQRFSSYPRRETAPSGSKR